MSEAEVLEREAADKEPSPPAFERIFDTRQPFDLSDELRARVDALRPVECYDFLDEEWLEGKPYALRVLLGREDFLNTPEGAFHHGMKIPTAMNWSKC